MQFEHLLPESFCWDCLPSEKILGTQGNAFVKKYQAGNIQLRMVRYSEGYLADHWCEKGHIVLVQAGELTVEHADGTERELSEGSVYVVGDKSLPHRLHTTAGATLFIID